MSLTVVGWRYFPLGAISMHFERNSSMKIEKYLMWVLILFVLLVLGTALRKFLV
jgi:hypothetical protein